MRSVLFRTCSPITSGRKFAALGGDLVWVGRTRTPLVVVDQRCRRFSAAATSPPTRSKDEGRKADGSLPKAATDMAKEEEKPPAKLGIKDLIARYGASIAVAYASVWAVTGVGLYTVVDAYGAETIVDLVTQTGVGNYVDLDRINPKVGTVAVALVLNELAEPVRLPLFLLCVRPFIARYEERLRQKGIDPAVEATQNPSLLTKLKQYGPFGIVYYTGVWAGTGVLTFGAVSLFGSDFAINGLNTLGVGEYVDLSSLDPKLGNAAVAFVVNELLEPIRLPFALASLPRAHKAYTESLKPVLLRAIGRQ